MNIYYAPYFKELVDEGYLPEYINPKTREAVDHIYRNNKSPIRTYYSYYMNKYKQNNHELVRKLLSAYIYGLAHPQQFANEPINAVMSGLISSNRTILSKYLAFIAKEPSKYILIPYYSLLPMAEALTTILLKEAREHIRRMNGEQVPYWFEKPKRKRLHKKISETGVYKIERYYGHYE